MLEYGPKGRSQSIYVTMNPAACYVIVGSYIFVAGFRTILKPPSQRNLQVCSSLRKLIGTRAAGSVRLRDVADVAGVRPRGPVLELLGARRAGLDDARRRRRRRRRVEREALRRAAAFGVPAGVILSGGRGRDGRVVGVHADARAVPADEIRLPLLAALPGAPRDDDALVAGRAPSPALGALRLRRFRLVDNERPPLVDKGLRETCLRRLLLLHAAARLISLVVVRFAPSCSALLPH